MSIFGIGLTDVFLATGALLAAGMALQAADLPEGAAEQLKNLWDMTKVREVPLNVEKISTRKAPLSATGASDWMRTGDSWVAPSKKGDREQNKEAPPGDEQLIVEEYYFNCGTTPAGPDRIFCALARPEKAGTPVPVLLVFHGGGGHGSGALAVATARNNPGMAALSMDYNGQFRPGEKYVTQWRSITEEMRRPGLHLIPDLRNCPMHHYVVAARRAIDFLEGRQCFDMSRVGCFGISYGGWVALILAGVDERVKCVVNGVSAGGTDGTASRSAQPLRWDPPEQRSLWLAAYDPISYAAKTKAGVFLNLGANDRFFWLSGAAKNYAMLAGEKRWLVRPNCDHGAGGPEWSAPTSAWVRRCLLGEEAPPEIRPGDLRAEGRKYRWTLSGGLIRRAVLCWSPGKVVSPARYWVCFPAEQEGDAWQADIPQRYAGLAGEVYATVFDAKDKGVSSATVSREGTAPYTEPGPLWEGESLWDAERGADAWRPLTPGGGPRTKIETAPRGVRIGPESGETKFRALTDSVVLASGLASQRKGIRLVVNGSGQGGSLTVSLVRDPCSLDEVSYSAPANYGPGPTALDLPWTKFKASRQDVPPNPWPFNGLQLEGERTGGNSLTIEAIEWAM